MVVTTGDLAERHRSYDAAMIRDRVVPGRGWSDLWGAGVEDRMSFAMPGCELTTMAPFAAVAADITLGSYRVVRVVGAG